MSVIVKDLSKLYGTQKAVDGISFEAKKGEALGFLGPNGAGKSTTMKILTCFIPQSSGYAEVCGIDVVKDPIEVRRNLGYLPEHNPLHKEMYVKEYLQFVASIYQVEKPKKRISELIELTGLGLEQNKLIGQLSKGYRQRVGLAQAMMNDPKVLILDEPTSGLDPNQLVEIRKLIKDLAKEKTVIFSTHIMQEVQALCERVIIINKGRIVADDSIDHLKSNLNANSVLNVEFSQKAEVKAIAGIKGIAAINELGGNRYQLTFDPQQDIRADVFEFAVKNHLILLEMHLETSSVEDVFQKLTA
ncbi:MAG: gliding motility-associated ABC transporter ATP-binding subunit GldA [Saprospiraceae bacterium]